MAAKTDLKIGLANLKFYWPLALPYVIFRVVSQALIGFFVGSLRVRCH